MPSPWIRAHLARLFALVTERPPDRAWRWELRERAGRQKIHLISHRGRAWELKLHRGAWLRPADPEKPHEKQH